jgi:uncharacterized membrane protein
MQNKTADQSLQTKSPRIALLDVARGVAMIAMTIFHFSWDLEFFGYAPQGMTSEFGWKFFARTIATSFLVMAGMSFTLTHINGMRWHAFWRRFAMVAAGAALISVATCFITPDRFVFFGILHQIAAASLLCILFMRLPALVILCTGVVFWAVPYFFRNELFLEPYFWWTGLAPYEPPTNDYVPIFPWSGYMLAGMGIAKFGIQAGWTNKLRMVRVESTRPGKFLCFLGNHSLIYYILHQPVMMAALYGLTLLTPPAGVDKSVLFIPQCISGCARKDDEAFCKRFCGCVRQELEKQAIFQEVLGGKRDVTSDPLILDIASVCTGAAQE